jgi:hypothetical protein
MLYLFIRLVVIQKTTGLAVPVSPRGENCTVGSYPKLLGWQLSTNCTVDSYPQTARLAVLPQLYGWKVSRNFSVGSYPQIVRLEVRLKLLGWKRPETSWLAGNHKKLPLQLNGNQVTPEGCTATEKNSLTISGNTLSEHEERTCNQVLYVHHLTPPACLHLQDM